MTTTTATIAVVTLFKPRSQQKNMDGWNSVGGCRVGFRPLESKLAPGNSYSLVKMLTCFRHHDDDSDDSCGDTSCDDNDSKSSSSLVLCRRRRSCSSSSRSSQNYQDDGGDDGAASSDEEEAEENQGGEGCGEKSGVLRQQAGHAAVHGGDTGKLGLNEVMKMINRGRG